MDEDEIHNRVLSSLSKCQNVVMASQRESQEKTTSLLHKALSKKFKNICVITSDRSFPEYLQKLGEEGVDYSKYSGIDCTAGKTLDAQPNRHIHISSPSSLTDLWIALETIMDTEKIDVIILDNVSSLINYNKELMVLRFLHSFASRLRKTGTKGIYLILKENESAIGDLALFTDETIKTWETDF
ncbi:MAG: hypothetical protein HY392_04775 [Candidatus Diapherotrites archaeon]|nr:hypothetical protein [Candidatus Diapherotrites archaeon]